MINLTFLINSTKKNIYQKLYKIQLKWKRSKSNKLKPSKLQKRK